jgi:hypothetical protein
MTVWEISLYLKDEPSHLNDGVGDIPLPEGRAQPLE